MARSKPPSGHLSGGGSELISLRLSTLPGERLISSRSLTGRSRFQRGGAVVRVRLLAQVLLLGLAAFDSGRYRKIDDSSYQRFHLANNEIKQIHIVLAFDEKRLERLLVSKKKEETCTPVPIFHKANTRRLFFGEVFNTTRFYFYNAYAYADYCVSPEGECLGVFEIQEYVDKKGLHLYDEAGRKDLKDSGLGQKFYIAGIGN